MILISNCNFPLETDFENLAPAVAKILKTDEKNIKSVKLNRKSVDARHRSNIHFCCSVLAEVIGNEDKYLKIKNVSKYNYAPYRQLKVDNSCKERPVIVGFGPAGMFCALILARAGLKPIVFERGADVDTRTADVERFFSGGKLNENSNVQFGEGGAGTFSDGKLNTGIKDTRLRFVLETFAEFGAGDNILIDSKPHIGTDVLKTVVKNIRNEIIRLGGEVNFNSTLTQIGIKDGKITSVFVNNENIPCNRLVICTGHSARDTFKMLLESGLDMQQKPFAIGVRIEHLQSDINKALYGDFADNKALKAADYKLVTHLESGRGVYTFCMCPGGEVINASSENGKIAVNGMSNSARDGANANSALLVGVDASDFETRDILAGCALQEKIEKSAYAVSSGKVPITTVGHFVFGKEAKIGKVKPTAKPEFAFCEMEDIFPKFVTDSIKEAIKKFDNNIKGFADFDAVITAPETRSSSPVRILRYDDGQSNIKGIYPCGEGAGYAGGITSAAVDGIIQAENIIKDCL